MFDGRCFIPAWVLHLFICSCKYMWLFMDLFSFFCPKLFIVAFLTWAYRMTGQSVYFRLGAFSLEFSGEWDCNSLIVNGKCEHQCKWSPLTFPHPLEKWQHFHNSLEIDKHANFPHVVVDVWQRCCNILRNYTKYS